MKKVTAIILSVCMLLLASSCNMIQENNVGQSDYPVTIGNLVLEKAPGKIAVLSENVADVIIACGYEGRLAARSDGVGQEALSILPSVGTPDTPDADALKELGVDLVIADTCFEDDMNEKLDSLGINTLIFKPANDIESLGKLYNNTAAAVAGGYTGKMKAITVYEDLRDSLEQIKISASSDNIVATGCYVYDLREDACTVAHGNDFADLLFGYAAVTNVAAADDDGSIGVDTLLKSNPDVIFCAEGTAVKIKMNKDLKTLKAIANNTIYEIPEKYMTLQGLTCLQTTDFIAAKAHKDYEPSQTWPEAFEQKQAEEKPVEDSGEYEPPFEPQVEIYYTVGEDYEPIIHIEQRLIDLGYMTGEADTVFTEETADAVSSFQSVNGLSITGIAEYYTLTKLLSADAKPKPQPES